MEKNKLLEVINREDLKIGEDGYVKFRSGMDACADPLVLDGTHISDLIRDWFEHNKKVREENGWV